MQAPDGLCFSNVKTIVARLGNRGKCRLDATAVKLRPSDRRHAATGRPGDGCADPWRERDACGVGFVAQASGARSTTILRHALQALVRVAHRGAVATDRSGDGAGVLTQIPVPLFEREAARLSLRLAPGQPFAVAVVFLPGAPGAQARVTGIIEAVLAEEGLPLLGWRDVPVDLDALGPHARGSCPVIRQALVGAPSSGSSDELSWERALYLARRTIERRVADGGPGLEQFFVCSMSCRTIVYKALLTGTDLARFYPDLRRAGL